MKAKIAGIQQESIVDGPGFRVAIFFQGCPHNCDGCHNPETHDIDGGEEVEISYIIEIIKNQKVLTGITLSGGEPLLQTEAVKDIAKACHDMGKTVWMFTGFTYEQILQSDKLNALKHIDVLVDGKFEKELRSLELNFKGSSNQRIIDVQTTLKSGYLTLLNV